MSGGSPAFRSAVVAVLTPVIGTAVAVAINFATAVPDSVTLWLVVGGLTVVAAVLTATTATDTPSPRHAGPPTGAPFGAPNRASGWPPPNQPRQRSSGRGRAALIGLAVCAVVVAIVVPGARFAYGWITGNETGVERLAESRSASAGALALTVDGVEVTSHFTKVTMTVRNDYDTSVTLPVFGYSQLTSGAVTVEGEPFRSRWPDTVPPGQSRTGTITFGEPLPDSATSVTVTFTTVFGALHGPDSLSVEDVPLRPV
ncbi:hypothetical protein [Saccharothrix deserti]|uniref:hypothetical protein n=1 Tax=Saccharothrix deserti TaxID=2593674 RepID=UPI00131B1B5C|nr:hypothetical protein [Saccharothrix deserti]